jgi:hypothetical protein
MISTTAGYRYVRAEMTKIADSLNAYTTMRTKAAYRVRHHLFSPLFDFVLAKYDKNKAPRTK